MTSRADATCRVMGKLERGVGEIEGSHKVAGVGKKGGKSHKRTGLCTCRTAAPWPQSHLYCSQLSTLKRTLRSRQSLRDVDARSTCGTQFKQGRLPALILDRLHTPSRRYGVQNIYSNLLLRVYELPQKGGVWYFHTIQHAPMSTEPTMSLRDATMYMLYHGCG